MQEALADYDSVQVEVNRTYQEAVDSQRMAEGLQLQAEQLNTTANAISLQQLSGKDMW